MMLNMAAMMGRKKVRQRTTLRNKVDPTDFNEDDTDEEEEAAERAKRVESEKAFARLAEKIKLGLGIIPKSDEDTPEHPDGYFYDPQYHQDHNIFIRKYLQYFSMPAVTTLENEYFNNFVIGIIMIAGLNVGVQTYPQTDTLFFTILDHFILAVFMLECLLKILAEGLRPLRYFYGPEFAWNNFDFLIIFFSLPLGLFDGGKSIQMLRLIRLARLGKLIRKIPPLAMIVSGLLGGLASVAYILLLLFLVFYLYGIIGFYLYSGDDPFHFGNLPMALLVLWRIMLMDNWTDIMYVNIFGCDYYWNVYVDPSLRNPNNKMFWCTNPKSHYYDAPIFFISFVVISSFIMLSLFIGAITTSMAENTEKLKQERTERILDQKKKRNTAKMQANEAARKAVESKLAARERWPLMSLNQTDSENGIESERIQANVYNVETEMTKVLRVALGDVKAANEKDEEEENEEKTTFSYVRFYYEKWGDLCMHIALHPVFSHMMTVVICIAGLNVGAQTDLRLQRIPAMMTFLSILDSIILAFFTLEVALKLFGEKTRPLKYFKSNWNKFDFAIVVGSYIPGVGTGITILRLLRLLRILKLVKRLPQLAVIINALINGLASIGYIGVILLLVFYVFAITGIILFKQNDPWHFESLHLAMISLFRTATLDNTNNVMYINIFGCDVGGLIDIYAQYPDLCTEPQATPFLAVIYNTLFVTLASQILLTLFIGVISTSMEESKAEKEIEIGREQLLVSYAAETGLTDIQIRAFQEVFQMLDLDGEGVITDEELKIGLGSIDMYLSDTEIADITNMVDRNDEGLDLVKFIMFMFSTPKYAEGAAAAKAAYKIKRKEMKKQAKAFALTWRSLVRYFPCLEWKDIQLEHEAALVLQDSWRRKMAKRAAAAEVEAKKVALGFQEQQVLNAVTKI
jgi:voltage-gated sodium channel